MAKKNLSLEDTVAELRALSDRVAEDSDVLPAVTAEKDELDKSMGLFDDAQKRQKIYDAEKRKATQDMVTALGRSKEAARQIRIGAKFRLGARNEKLSLYNVAPLRTHAGRKAAILRPPGPPAGTPTGAQTPAQPDPTKG
ncbi:MAG TPA: hypothetical protein VH988_02130 [Thermoanaerobaculia bacterium]|jgi:hypothetical protein|nr:hypothetical protein [Thermoanaerobaculia bacterium]